ncbi:putative transcriptional regulatory protein [Lachnellula suecica]|uniref:Putative transcriptional regulatory protein n=1 Tax=Lachnellula suecica TaxID=602035 RepID=A0A8T9CH52_9HELO|nr:putative transcriptional regulatory protein [Lachnellula suecica]
MSQRRSRDDSDQFREDGAPPEKARRIARACNQCRNRKQRCDGPSQVDLSRPCQRCIQLGFTCSFTSTPLETEIENSSVAIRKVGKIQKQLLDHQRRIEGLEQALREVRGHEKASVESRILDKQNDASFKDLGEGDAKSYSESAPKLSGDAVMNV